MTQCIPEISHAVITAPAPPGDFMVVNLRAELEGLQIAMRTRASIDHAIGILMCRFGVDDDIAFGILRRWSMTANLKLRDLALALIEITAHRTTVFTADSHALAAVRGELDAIPNVPNGRGPFMR